MEQDKEKNYMLTSIIGYPKVGKLRELKLATEKYFRSKISVDELQQTAKKIRKTRWNILKDNGLDFIPSNDFYLYDNILDTTLLYNIIPNRYKELDLSEIDTYFAMARGYQGKRGDVKALAMKKVNFLIQMVMSGLKYQRLHTMWMQVYKNR